MSISFIEGFRGRAPNSQKKGPGSFWARTRCAKVFLILMAAFLLGRRDGYSCENNDKQLVHTYVMPNGPGTPWSQNPGGDSCGGMPPGNSGDGVFWDLPPSPYFGGLHVYPPTSALATVRVSNFTTDISFWMQLHGIHYDRTIYYKWSETPCGSPSVAWCGDPDGSQWKQASGPSWVGSGNTDNCRSYNADGPNPQTNMAEAESAFNVPHGGHYFLLVYFKTLVCQWGPNPIDAVATYRYYVPSVSPPVVTLSPSSGTYANSNAPANIGVTATGNADAQIDTATYRLTYDGTGSNCSKGQVISSGNVDYPNAGSFQVPFNPFGGGPACGDGDYHLKVSVTDTGMANTTVISTYTIVDLTPPSFSGATVDQKQIAYTWTASTHAVANHFEIWINDPSDPTNAGAVFKTADGTPTSQTVDYSNTPQRMPPGIIYHANFYSSATLHACLDPACAGFGISNSTSNYTLANPATSASVVPSTITASFAWLINDNYNQNVHSSPNGTEYRVLASSDGITQIPATRVQTQDPQADPNAQELVTLSGLRSNTSYYYTIESINGDNVSTFMPLDLSRIFWTFPNTPGSTLNPSSTNNSVTAGFAFPDNPVVPNVTQYVLQAQISDFSQGPRESAQIPQGAVGSTTTVTISGLTPGSSYVIRACAISLAPQHLRYCGPDSSPITTNIGAGVLIPPPTATSITAQWTLSPQSNVVTLQAIADGPDGSLDGSNSIPAQLNPPPITVSNLPISNTSYTLILQHIDVDASRNQLPPVSYPSSDVVGLTLAATPGAPKLFNGGNAANGLTLTVALSTDTNSSDSQYAMEITPPSGSVFYLTGVANGTSGSPTYMTTAQWAAGANTFDVPSNVTYQARVQVQEKYTDNGFPSVVFSAYTSILTPGLVFINSFSITSGVTLDNVPFGVQTGAPLIATFNVPIDTSSLSGKITISSGTGGSPVPANWVYTLVNGPTGVIPTVTITPTGSAWTNNTDYQVFLAPGVNDIFGYTSQQSTSTFFVTAPALGPNLTFVSNVVTPLDTNRTSVVGVPGNSIPVGGFVVPRVQFIDQPKMAPAGSQNLTKQGIVQVLARAEVDI